MGHMVVSERTTMNTTIKVKVGTLEGLLKGLVSLDSLGFDCSSLILDVAENINVVRDVMGDIHREVGELAVSVQSRGVLAGSSAEPPQVEFNRRRQEILEREVQLELWSIPVEALLEGDPKVAPTVLAELMPLVRNLQNVRLPEN